MNSLLFLTFIIPLFFFTVSANASDSICYGTPSNGRLEHGKQLPKSGKNFAAYSPLGIFIGRTFLHSKVASVVTAAYKSLEISSPDKYYIYGETGWETGGRIRPHRTHQNGTSVDFMVAIQDKNGKSIPLPTGIANKYGYSIEFDKDGKWKGFSIDYDAISEHLYALYSASETQKIKIKRVIFDRTYIPNLYKTQRGEWIKKNISFMQTEPWIRHDEHYHVDFEVKCAVL